MEKTFLAWRRGMFCNFYIQIFNMQVYLCSSLCALFVFVACVFTICVHSLPDHPGMWVGSASVQSFQGAAMIHWWLLFQKPDQIEVGVDGFKQWDGKTANKRIDLPHVIANFMPPQHLVATSNSPSVINFAIKKISHILSAQ